MRRDSSLVLMPFAANGMAIDGAQWIVELRDGDRYHYVDRCSPEVGPMRELGEQIMASSQQDFGKIY